jgi:hypothetical protein
MRTSHVVPRAPQVTQPAVPPSREVQPAGAPV